VIDASLNATQDLTEAKKASLIGAVVSVAAEKGVEEEHQIRATLMDIVDQRVQRLENRIALMDDVEALLEAERVSLELERRDMYTTRCRQWFGDGSS
jgi:SWI/SNF related-matrix-associated actin-dependent regulator of chromatin subfamily C